MLETIKPGFLLANSAGPAEHCEANFLLTRRTHASQIIGAGIDFAGCNGLCQRTEGLSERQVVADGIGEMRRRRKGRKEFRRRSDWNRLRSQEDTGTSLPGVCASDR